MSLDRFKSAQQDSSSGFETALAELQAGRKTSHWIWYIFPQLASLGRSSTARFYGLSDLNEACDYLNDSLLRGRLLRVTEAVGRHLVVGVPVLKLMGGETDSFKLASSLTLFELADEKILATKPGAAASDLESLSASCGLALTATERQGFPRCRHTLDSVASEGNGRATGIEP